MLYNIPTHITDFNNPHHTTATQVGAYSSGQTDTLLNLRVSTGTTVNGHLLNGNVVVTPTDLGVYTSGQTDTLLNNKVDKNSTIVGGIYTKITFDSKGLVTSGQTATTNDIPDSTNKRYVTDALYSGITHTNRSVIDLLSSSGGTLYYNGSQVGTVQIQSDFNQNNSGATDYIKNRPTITSLSGYTINQTDALLALRVSTGTTVNGHLLNGNVVVTPTDLGVYTSGQTDILLNNKVDKNSTITGGTFTKITFDSKGLVTSGQTATTNDIPDSTNKRYVTDALYSGITHSNRTVIDALTDSGGTLYYNGGQIGNVTTDATLTGNGTAGSPLHVVNAIPTSLAIFKQGANSTVLPQVFKWTYNLTVSSVQLMSNCDTISVTVNGNTYNHTTLVGVTIVAGVELTINDMTIHTGQNNANAIIIF